VKRRQRELEHLRDRALRAACGRRVAAAARPVRWRAGWGRRRPRGNLARDPRRAGGLEAQVLDRCRGSSCSGSSCAGAHRTSSWTAAPPHRPAAGAILHAIEATGVSQRPSQRSTPECATKDRTHHRPHRRESYVRPMLVNSRP
jgi:hypothetical protein